MWRVAVPIGGVSNSLPLVPHNWLREATGSQRTLLLSTCALHTNRRCPIDLLVSTAFVCRRAFLREKTAAA